jgi:hypothetical protein
MLRKTANILFLIVFLATSMGFSITKHYCGNNLIKTSLGNVEDCCKNCNQCHNKVSHIKIKDTYDTGDNAFSLVDHSVFLSIPIFVNDFLIGSTGNKLSIFADISPPPLILSNSFLQVFRN